MGYTTYFTGAFDFDRPLDDATYALLKGLSTTRRALGDYPCGVYETIVE